MNFEMHTASLMVGLLYLALPLFTWIVLGEQRNRAAALWCGGGMAMGVGTVLFSAFAGKPYAALALSLPTLFNTLSFVVRIQSLRLDLNQPARTWHLVLIMVASTVVFETLHRGLALYVPRAVYASLVFVVGSLLLAYYAYHIGTQEKSRTARWISVAYLVTAIAYAWRMGYLLQQDMARTDGNLATEGLISAVVAVSMMVSSVIGHFGYVGLALERTQRRAVGAAEEQARLEVSQQLGAQIAVLERRQSLGEFAASIGHELKQPLTAILTNTQLVKRGLKSGRMEPEAADSLLEKIEYNTQRASKILERIRDYMRSGQTKQEKVDLHIVVQDVVELVEGEFRQLNVRIEIGLVQGPVWVSGDALQLSQVLLNLLRNAMDSMAYSESRSIRIECTQENGRARLSVRDWGPGLTDGHLSQVGAPFFSTKPHGLGMGLAISRTIARNHGGTLSLDNVTEGAGKGALAVLDLPALEQETA